MFVITLGWRRLKFVFCMDGTQAEVDPDQVFLSKLTGILAFKKMSTSGVEIKFVFKDAQTVSRKRAFPSNN